MQVAEHPLSLAPDTDADAWLVALASSPLSEVQDPRRSSVPSAAAAAAACHTAVSPGPVSRSSSEESLAREEAAVLKHGFWALIAIGAVTGLAAGFLTGATGVCAVAATCRAGL